MSGGVGQLSQNSSSNHWKHVGQCRSQSRCLAVVNRFILQFTFNPLGPVQCFDGDMKDVRSHYRDRACVYNLPVRCLSDDEDQIRFHDGLIPKQSFRRPPHYFKLIVAGVYRL